MIKNLYNDLSQIFTPENIKISNKLSLTETGSDAKVKRVDINSESDMILISGKALSAWKDIFKSNGGKEFSLKKNADYVLMYKEEERLICYIIELKSGFPEKVFSKAFFQLISTQLHMSILFNSINSLEDINIEWRGGIFSCPLDDEINETNTEERLSNSKRKSTGGKINRLSSYYYRKFENSDYQEVKIVDLLDLKNKFPFKNNLYRDSIKLFRKDGIIENNNQSYNIFDLKNVG